MTTPTPPAPAVPQGAPAPDALPAAFLRALEAPVPPAPKPPQYRWAAAGVAAGMLVLPLVYVLFVACVAAAVVWYGLRPPAVLADIGSVQMKALIYLGPLLIGGVLVLFLVKPLFAPRRERSEPVSLRRDDEPALFAFVERLTRAVGAPMPRRIDVDCLPNASASFRRGVLSMGGHDLVLTIGLPLAGALPARHLAGVLAHEFGHFTQGAGMRLTYLVERISHWFERVVYERDAWDERIEGLANAGGWSSIVFGLSLYGVALGRWVLRLLMNAGRRLSRALLRQMEFDADRYEIEVAGTAAFAETSERLALLGAAFQGALSDLVRFHRDGRLPDDLPALALGAEADLPDAVRAQVLQHVRTARTGPLDTHPATADRVRHAERVGAPGRPFPDAPARSLFADFDALCRRATAAHFEAVLGEASGEVALFATAEALSERAAEAAGFESLGRYLQGAFGAWAPPVGPALLDGDAPADPRAELEAARAAVLARADVARAQSQRLSELAGARFDAERARGLTLGQVKFQAADFGLPPGAASESASITAHTEALADGRAACEAALGSFGEAVRRRLGAALRSAAARAEPDVALGEVRPLLDALAAYDAARAERETLAYTVAQTLALADALRQNQAQDRAARTLEERLGVLAKALRRLRGALADAPFPFAHGQGSLTLAGYLLPSLPASSDGGATLGTSLDVLNDLEDVRARAWARLAAAAESVEAAFDLPPLPAPSETAPADATPASSP